MERIWLRTWSGLVWLVRVTLYCGWKEKPRLARTRAEQQRSQVVLWTLILRGPSRKARLLLGVSMLMTLSRPRSREPKTFPPRFFFPLSSVTARSRDRDLRTSGQMVTSSSKYDTTVHVSMMVTHLLSGLKVKIPMSGISLFSTVVLLLWSLELLFRPRKTSQYVMVTCFLFKWNS